MFSLLARLNFKHTWRRSLLSLDQMLIPRRRLPSATALPFIPETTLDHLITPYLSITSPLFVDFHLSVHFYILPHWPDSAFRRQPQNSYWSHGKIFALVPVA
ncbi:hypothetical protein CDAR_446721 [Caerostris darwini]|uniref:Uncharacterized protein n=1 Tax=Caerostris darwini TaxID=1538125 RepID=A0AAV4WBU4_9ARAC|nr:hypothetical protein CDAR_446721 [Caerostris darwini]